ncbi:unnamed protein product [Effrenium voratum]|nr:unnamed protein product [Effrenium voratum]
MTASQDKSVRLWNPHSGKHIKKFVGCHNQEVNDVLTLGIDMAPPTLQIAADNSKFVSGGSDKLIFLWDVTSGQVIRKFTGHDRKVNALAFGPKEEVLLSASHDKTVKVWDMRARGHRPMQTLTGAVDSVLCLRVYGDEILTGSVDGGLRSYDVRQGQVVTDQLLQPIGSISVSNDGQCLLVSTLDRSRGREDSKIHLLEHQDGSELMSYSGHANKRVKVQSALDPSDSFVASGSEARVEAKRRALASLERFLLRAKSQVDGKPSCSTPSGATFDLFAQSPFLVNHPFPSIAFYHHRFSCWCDRQGMRNGIDPLLWCILLRDVRTSTFCQPMGFPY